MFSLLSPAWFHLHLNSIKRSEHRPSSGSSIPPPPKPNRIHRHAIGTGRSLIPAERLPTDNSWDSKRRHLPLPMLWNTFVRPSTPWPLDRHSVPRRWSSRRVKRGGSQRSRIPQFYWISSSRRGRRVWTYCAGYGKAVECGHGWLPMCEADDNHNMIDQMDAAVLETSKSKLMINLHPMLAPFRSLP